MLSKEVSSTIFKVFGMTWPGIKLKSPEPLANPLPTRPMTRLVKKLNDFNLTCLRKILNITWQKHIPNTKVLTRASLPNIYTILMQSQLRWVSHVIRMKDHHLLKKLLSTELSQSKHSQGGKKKALQRQTEGLHEIFLYHP